MHTKILFIGWEDEWLKKIVGSSTELVGTGFETDTPHIEYDFYGHLAARNVINKAVKAEKDGFDAVVIGCFYDPGLREARELVKIPVVGVCEASLHLASMIAAGKFSVLVGRRKWIPHLADNARNYGFESKIASWRVMNLGVEEMVDIDKTQSAILRESRGAIDEDMSECIVLGCTGMSGQARKAQDILGIPVLDPVVMGLKMAELRAILWKRFGISHSKTGGYDGPPSDELEPIYRKVYGS